MAETNRPPSWTPINTLSYMEAVRFVNMVLKKSKNGATKKLSQQSMPAYSTVQYFRAECGYN